MRPRKKISQNDIAEALGISNVSVSNALAGRKGVSRELSEMIRRKAAELGYGTEEKPGMAAGTIVVIVSDAWPEEKAGQLEAVVADCGFRAEICSLREVLGGQQADKWKAPGCYGVLLPEQFPTGVLRLLYETIDKPIAGAGFFDVHVPIDYMLDDGFHGAQMAVRYLYGKGYENIQYVLPDEKPPGMAAEAAARMQDDRVLGFRCGSYLRELGQSPALEEEPAFDLDETRNILAWKDVESYLDAQRQEPGGSETLMGKIPRTAFLCGDRPTSEAVLRLLSEKGFRVPEDAAVLGYHLEGECAGRAGSGRMDEGDTAWQEDGEARSASGRITAYRNDWRVLLGQCCLLLRQRAEDGGKSGRIHMISGEIAEGDTTTWQNK